MSQDPRAQVRDMIAETVSGQLDLQRWAVEGWPTIADDLADEVMELFPEVWQHHTAAGPCYVLRTTPTGETCRHCGDARRAEETTPGDDTIRTYTRTTSTSTFTTPWTVGGATRRSGPRTDLEIEDALDAAAARRALADPAPSIPLDEVLAVQDHPAVRVATDALAERLEAMWGDAPDGFGRVMLREYADAVAPAVLRWAGDQIRAEATLWTRAGAGYSYAYGFADAAEFIDPPAEGKTGVPEYEIDRDAPGGVFCADEAELDAALDAIPPADAEEIQSEKPIPYATTGPEVKPEKDHLHQETT